MVRLEYIKKQYPRTRRVHGNWYLSSYTYKFNVKRINECLEHFRKGELVGLKCRSCNTVAFPPRLICGKCLRMPDEWVHLRETATVATFSATYDKEAIDKPIPVVAIRQDGADTTWLANLPQNYDFFKVYVGMPLKAKWAKEKKGDFSDIEYYEPIEDPSVEMNKKEQTEK
jgi:uncharacterized OB-fold protein